MQPAMEVGAVSAPTGNKGQPITVTLTTDTAVALQLVERRRLLVVALAVLLAASSAVRLTLAAKRAFRRPPVRSHPAPAAVRISAADSVVEELTFWMVAKDVSRDAANEL